MDGNLTVILGAILIAGIVIFGIYWRIKKNPNNSDSPEEQAKAFLSGLGDIIYNKITDIIASTNVKDFDSLESYEKFVLKEIEDEIWAYVENKLVEVAKTDILSAITLAVINKDFVEMFISELIALKENRTLTDKVTSIYFANQINELSDYMITEDGKLAEEYSDPSKFIDAEENDTLRSYQGNDTIESIEGKLARTDLSSYEREELLKKKEEIENLRPQNDDEEAFDMNTMEAM